MNKRLEELLSNNNISQSEFEEKLYITLLRGVFEAICKDMKKNGSRIQEKERFRKTRNKITATKMLVNKYVGCKLEDKEYEELSKLFIAYFQTGDPRKSFSEAFRSELLKKQGGECAVCEKKITIHDAHLDHIVPWIYVGDILENNYQMLCTTCNTRKGTATYFEISMQLLKSH